jgi:predicted kinase
LHTPLPLLVLIGGKPGTGKSALAFALSSPEYLGLPVLSRDAIKVGLVETYALHEPNASREAAESDDRRATIVPASFSLFYETIEAWLRRGVSLIAEYGFGENAGADVKPLLELAHAAFLECHAPDDVARDRYVQRETSDPRHRPDRLETTRGRILAGTDPWSVGDSLRLPIPTLSVTTSDGYSPALAIIAQFCRDRVS